MTVESEKFNSAFVDAVDRSLRGILGNIAAEAVYAHLQKEYAVAKDDVLKEFTVFVGAVRTIFGRAAPTVERAIAKRLYSKLGLTLVTRPEERLEEYVEDAFHRASDLECETTGGRVDERRKALVRHISSLG